MQQIGGELTIGDVWRNSTSQKLYRWNGVSWDDITTQVDIDSYYLGDDWTLASKYIGDSTKGCPGQWECKNDA